MFSQVEIANKILSVFGLFGQVATVILLLTLVLPEKFKKLIKFISKYALMIVTLISAVSVSSSLYYSEVVGYRPCELCWYQRIFMYPLFFIFGLALYKKDKNVLDYGLLLSGIGTVIAIYHNLVTYGFNLGSTCTVLGTGCAKQFFMKFGYITIPMLSLTAFALITTLLLVKRSAQHREK